MNMEIDLTLKKSIITVAKIKGDLEIKMIAEKFTGDFVKGKIIDALKEKGFEGQIITDGFINIIKIGG